MSAPRTRTDPEQTEEAERVVLGALMIQPGLVDDVSAILTSGDFYKPAHGAIWAAITANAALGEPTEPLAIAVTITRFGEIGRIPGGAAYLHTCMESVPTVCNATWYARLVAERAYARRAEEAAIRLQHVAASGGREEIANALDGLQVQLAAGAAEGAGPAWRAKLGNGASFIYDVPDKVPAVWGDGDDVLWARGEALMICGPQGVGKTTLAGQIIMARLGLLPGVLGWPVEPTQRRVLYLAMDRPQQAARSLGRLARPEWRDTIHDRLVVWQGPPPTDFALSSTVLLEMCRAADADSVVIDSVKDAAVGISKDEVGAGYNRCRQAAIASGVEVLELHHQRKSGENGGKPKSLADVYGSVWITGGAGSVLLLWGEPGDPLVELHHLKKPINDVGPLGILHDHPAGTSEIDRGDKSKDLVFMARHQPRGLTAKAAAVSLFSAQEPDRNQVEKARRKLDSYVKSGVMVRREGERGGGEDRQAATYFLVERRDDGR